MVIATVCPPFRAPVYSSLTVGWHVDAVRLAQGKDLFRRGVLSEAVLALEAEVQRTPRNVDAWRLLGTVHAENDDDVQV